LATTITPPIKFKPATLKGWKGLTFRGRIPIDTSAIPNAEILAVIVASISEGTYDSVQTYDRGIVSWGIRQWTFHAGSLQACLKFIQDRLDADGLNPIWNKFFPNLKIVSETELNYNGKSYKVLSGSGVLQTELMQLFRGTISKTEYDTAIMESWMTKFVVASREPIIQRLQLEFAAQNVKDSLNQLVRKPKDLAPIETCDSPPMRLEALPGAKKLSWYIGHNKRAISMFNAMYTQNPRQAKGTAGRAVEVIRKTHGLETTWNLDIKNEVCRELERLFKSSCFACWGTNARDNGDCKGRELRYEKTLKAFVKYST
jgi:hypothetical protein